MVQGVTEKRKKGTLTKEEIVEAASSLVEEAGPAAASMRAVAKRVGVTAMAVYGYVPSQEALLNEVCAGFLERVDCSSRAGERWEATLLRVFDTLRRACEQHPHMAHLLIHQNVGAGLEPYMMRVRALFLVQGMPEEIAIQLVSIADSYVTGFMLRRAQRLEHEEAAAASASRAGNGAPDAVGFATASRVPGMLTGRRDAGLRPNERWRKTVEAGYSQRSFENGLFAIIEGIRVGAAPDPCDWKTPARR